MGKFLVSLFIFKQIVCFQSLGGSGVVGPAWTSFWLTQWNERRQIGWKWKFCHLNRFVVVFYCQCLIRSCRRKYSRIKLRKYSQPLNAVKTYWNHYDGNWTLFVSLQYLRHFAWVPNGRGGDFLTKIYFSSFAYIFSSFGYIFIIW